MSLNINCLKLRNFPVVIKYTTLLLLDLRLQVMLRHYQPFDHMPMKLGKCSLLKLGLQELRKPILFITSFLILLLS